MQKRTPDVTSPYRQPPAGPSLILLALVHVLLFAGSLVAFTILGAGARIPTPLDTAQTVQEFTLAHGDAIRTAAFLQFGSAVPLGLFAAAVLSRLHFLGVNAVGKWIAFYGGAGASLLLALTGLSSWASADPAVAASTSTVRALQLLTFTLGGPGFAVFFGLLAAGVSVTSGVGRLLPRWLVWLGLACALCGELSALTLLSLKAAVFIPLTRFPGLVWLIGAASKLRVTPVEQGSAT